MALSVIKHLRTGSIAVPTTTAFFRRMHDNPTIKKFYENRPSKDFPKQTTGLSGIHPVEHPHRVLSVLYGRILRTLLQMPETAAYRTYTQRVVNERLQHVQAHPHRMLSVLYGRILRALLQMPETAAYRTYMQRVINERLQHVQAEPDISKLEEKIGMGQIEEVILQAENELACCRTMLEYAVWEPLIEKPSLDQWKWPV